ncbi:Cu(I)-responsive transcriptional regulator [Halieaceae bacterium IMCC14734]|uniref:Cu(I)-responsive transcriptional regulator n=1 Tax=Candidatus Litorirhabdus singularis TaxID=2518993 RepID=A0ABT3TJ16_9GAMM|nr:Cu(I)-responsive transcriptional regulator [Candidatus Litorirhabdus singularis]MCX2981785.1 Cu(I)-responsive transcriptional regulator [Candidatus Litorirhabdus singularis]
MNISAAAAASGLSSKTIRYYEDIELIPPASRADNGYRYYDVSAVEQLRFVHQARLVGFSVAECRQLLELQSNSQRHSAHVKSLVLEKCDQLEQRIEELLQMQSMLRDLASRCSGNEGPDCAILDELGRGSAHE